MNMTEKNRSIAALIVDKNLPKEMGDGVESDFEDAKSAAFEEFLEAIESKDVPKLKSSFKAIMDICSEEDQYQNPEEVTEG